MKLLRILFKPLNFRNRIVFVSGVFDIIHAGHIQFLSDAKKLVGANGQLIVAVHDDHSVQEHKGKLRPIHPLEDRVKVLESLKYVDKVIPWKGWENISNLVNLLEPDYIAVSGDEYKNKSIKECTDKLGAKLIVFPKYKDFSTTRIIDKLSEEHYELHKYEGNKS